MSDTDVVSSDLFNFEQRVALIVAPFFSGALSLLGSCAILHLQFKRKSAVSNHVYHRILLGISIVDVIASLNHVLGFVMVPKGFFLGAQGNTVSCSLNGFLFHLGSASSLYTLGLCLYFWCHIRLKLKDAFLARYVEPWIHGISLVIPIAAGIWAWIAGVLNPLELTAGWCYTNEYPPRCSTMAHVSCERGENYSTIARITGLGITIPVWVGILILMLLIWCYVRHQELKAHRFQFDDECGNMKQTKQTAVQALLYVGGFFLTYIFPIINHFVFPAFSEPLTEHRTAIFTLAFLTKFFLPLQGFFNFIVYVRPRLRRLAHENPEDSQLSLIWQVVTGGRLRLCQRQCWCCRGQKSASLWQSPKTSIYLEDSAIMVPQRIDSV